MFDCIIIGAGSASGTVAYHLAKRDNKGNPNIIATKGRQAPG
jgi:glycine/D-amino acid oxidase-like deaminating enzyme